MNKIRLKDLVNKENLIKLGFIEATDECFLIPGHKTCVLHYNGFDWDVYPSLLHQYSIAKVKYIFQIKNLCFILTGIELYI